MECWWWHIGIVTIYVDTITKIFVTGKLIALCHGDHYYCECHRSKKIKDRNTVFDPWEIYIFTKV